MTSAPDAIPEQFRERLARIYGADVASVIQRSLHEPAPLSFRVLGAFDSEELQSDCARAGLEIEAVSWSDAAFLVRSGDRNALKQTDVSKRGAIFIQSLSSMAAVEALDIRPGLHVLDLCAAPGGKTAMIALRQQGKGVLLANDRSRSRLGRLRSVLEQHGVSHAELSCCSGESFGGTHEACFDRILVDAPCSGEGMLNADDAAAWSEWSPSRIRRLAKQQVRLLVAGLRCLRPGGILVYSTCTYAPEENEAVLQRVMSKLDIDVEIEELPTHLPRGYDGLDAWEEVAFDQQIGRSRRLVPDGCCTGFFLARFRRRNDGDPEA